MAARTARRFLGALRWPLLLLLAQLAYAVPAAGQPPPPPPLALSLSVPPGPLAVGDETTATILVLNLGPTPLSAAQLHLRPNADVLYLAGPYLPADTTGSG
ncbi:MAG: hypothetical protein ACRDHL_14330 [Candidatus Promineifilaceae bacterium]